MKKAKSKILAALCLATLSIACATSASTLAGNSIGAAASEPQNGKILGTLNFDPKTDGYKFENYTNKGRDFKNDLTADDMIRLFGADTVCKTGNSAQNCVLKAAAQTWMNKELEGMDGGHCEGMAVTALRLKKAKQFKAIDGKPAGFQSGAAKTGDLSLSERIANYIAYYFVTQTFDELSSARAEASKNGPVAIAQKLAESMKNGDETYTFGFFKYNRETKEESDGHAITPIAVEDAGNMYRIHVYDNNFPGETRYLTIEKGGKQTWRYVSATNPGEPIDEYVGDIDTKTLLIAPTSAREKSCYEAPFAGESDEKKCAASAPKQESPDAEETVAEGDGDAAGDDNKRVGSTNKNQSGERAEFAINNDGRMLVVAPDGKRIGFDPATNKFYEEIAGGSAELVIGGRGRDLPMYRVPFVEVGNPYKVVFSGGDIKKESDFDFTYSAPGFTVGFDNVLLDPKESLTATVSPDGETITFTSSADAETPDIFFAFDPEDDQSDSYIVELDGAEIEAGKTLTVHLNFEDNKIEVKDNDGNADEYDLEITRIKANGKRETIKKDFTEEAGKELDADLDDFNN